MGADERQRLDERAGDAAVEDVADDRDVEAVEAAERLADRCRGRAGPGSRCWCLPSPALTTAAPEYRAASCGAPIRGWRTTIASGSYCASVRIVSFSDSPLSTDEPAAFSDMTSAESRLATARETQDVRVEDSKKRLSTSLPRRAGGFSSTPASAPAVSRISSTSLLVRSAIESRCLVSPRSSGAPTSRIRSAPSVSPSSTWIARSGPSASFCRRSRGRIGSSR